jgi:glycosyltransferase involved in cell wall biosynthesis
MINPRAFRWTALAEELARRGMHVTVVCSWFPGMPASEGRNGVDVRRVGVRGLEALRSLNAIRRDAPPSPAISADGAAVAPGAGRWRQLVVRALTRLWHGIYWPDTACLWYGPALSEVRRQLRRTSGMSVISVSPAFTAVAVGYALLRKRRSSGRWLIDLGDPFCCAGQAEPNNTRIYHRLNHAIERRSFDRADAVTVTNEALARRYARLFPESAHKIAVIPPLLSSSSANRFFTPPAAGIAKGASRRIIYLGTLYHTIRRPDFLLALFFAAQARAPHLKLELHFYGNAHLCSDSFAPYRSAMGSALYLHGLVAPAQAMHAIAAATALVNIGNDTPYQLPSKLVEYAATGKPIINLSRIAADCSIEFLRGYPAGILRLVDSGGPPSMEQVNTFLRFVQSEERPPSVEAIRAWLDPYCIDRVASAYETLLFPSAQAPYDCKHLEMKDTGIGA